MYDLSQPFIRQKYGFSDVCTWECFLRSDEFANLRSHPSCSHLNGFSPEKYPRIKQNMRFINIIYGNMNLRKKKVSNKIKYKIKHE